MKLENLLREILFGTTIESKLTCLDEVDDVSICSSLSSFENPGRPTDLKFAEKKIKFPKIGSFHKLESRISALHAFCNHELMAIEIFSLFLLKFSEDPTVDSRVIKSVIETIKDEQRHFRLYQDRIKNLGSSFGDLPVNSFFWNIAKKVSTPKQFFAVVAMSLEAANLDFALYYSDIFKKYDDGKSASILMEIYNDEIIHVARGVDFVRKHSKSDVLWDEYCYSLPHNFSPARAKGIIFDRRGREKAGLDPAFLKNIEDFKDKLQILNRKEK